MWDHQGEAGETPSRRHFVPFRSPVALHHDHGMQEVGGASPSGTDNVLPPLGLPRAYSSLDSYRTLAPPRSLTSRASYPEHSHLHKSKSFPPVTPSGHAVPLVHDNDDESIPDRSVSDRDLDIAADHGKDSWGARPHLPPMQGLRGQETGPRKLLPYSVLERIAHSGARSDPWSQSGPVLRRGYPADTMVNVAHLPPLARPSESLKYSSLPRMGAAGAEPHHLASDRAYLSDESSRYPVGPPRDFRSRYGPDLPYGQYHSSRPEVYPHIHYPPSEDRWPSYPEDEYEQKRYSRHTSAGYGPSDRQMRSHSQSYTYPSSLGASRRSASPSNQPYVYDSRNYGPSSAYGQSVRDDLYRSAEDTDYTPQKRPNSAISEAGPIKREDPITVSQPVQTSTSRVMQSKAMKGKSSDGTLVHDAPPKRGGKLPKPITDMLKSWLLEHADHPYPTEEEKRQFCEYTGLDICQISNWVR